MVRVDQVHVAVLATRATDRPAPFNGFEVHERVMGDVVARVVGLPATGPAHALQVGPPGPA